MPNEINTSGRNCKSLEESRKIIDRINKELYTLFVERMDTSISIAEYKCCYGLPIFHPEREKEIIENQAEKAPPELKEYVSSFFSALMDISKCYQINMVGEPFDCGAVEQPVTDRGKIFAVLPSYQDCFQTHYPCGKAELYEDYEDIFEAVTNRKSDYGIVPLLRNQDERFSETYTLLYQKEVYVNQTFLSEDGQTKYAVISPLLLSDKDNNEISISVNIKHTPGELNRLLTKFTLYHINLNKIESYPIEQLDNEMTFFIHFEGNLKHSNIAGLLNDLSFNHYEFKILGTYTIL